MFPYGWDLPDGTVLREQVYSGMVLANNASYFNWINPYADKAYFRKCARHPFLA